MTPLLNTLKTAVYPVSSALVAKAFLVEGTLKGTDVPFRTLFVHNTNFNESLRHKMYEGDGAVVREWRIVIPALRRQILQRRGDFDLAVAVLPPFYDRLFSDIADLRGREEIRQVIDTSGGWEAMRAEFAKKKRQTTNNFSERYGLSYRMSTSVQDFDLFYHRMHVPHIKRRYGELSNINPYEEMKKIFVDGGILLFVTKDGQDLAGALSVVKDGSLMFRRTGVLDGDEDAVKGGAQTALYYLQLQYAVEHGLKNVDTMKSAPFLNDGVFRHKSEWGATTLPDEEFERFVYLFTPGPKEKLARFFEANPLIVEAGSTLRAVVGDPKGLPAEAVAEEVQKRYHTKGLRDVLIYAPDGTKITPFVAPAKAPPPPAPTKPAKPAKGKNGAKPDKVDA